MPRRSFADLSTPRVTGLPAPRRLKASAALPEPARAVFDELVRSVAPDHFKPADRPMLEEMAVALVVTRGLHQRACDLEYTRRCPSVLRELRDQQRLIASLAVRCRLAPSSRITKRTAASGAHPLPHTIRPWEYGNDEGADHE